MKTLVLFVCCLMLAAAGASAQLISNGDFDADGQIRWRSDLGSRTDWVGEPAGWYSNLYHEGQINGNYGEPITGYGSGNCAALKAEGGNYLQQVLSGVDPTTANGFVISYDGGIRYNSLYNTGERDITLRVSLWDVTDDVELSGVDVVTAYASSATSLEARLHLLSYDPTGLAGHEIALRFANTTENPVGGANSNQALFDNVSVEVKGVPGIISPAPNGAVNVLRDTMIEWTAPVDPNIVQVFGYDFYFDPNESNVENATSATSGTLYSSFGLTGTSFDPPADLDYETTYYWRVDAIVDYDDVPGTTINEATKISAGTWFFTTASAKPVVTTQPKDQVAFPGDSVTFSVDAFSRTGSLLTYQWYKSSDNVADYDQAGTTDQAVGVDSDSLTINVNSDTAAAIANDQMYYYCVISNGGVEVSELAFLNVKYMIAHYAFESDAADSSISANDGTWGDVSQEDYNTDNPIIGTAAGVFTSNPNSYVNIGTTAVSSLQKDASQGTISYWVKTTSTNEMNICGTFNDGFVTGMGVNMNEGTQGRLAMYIRGEAGTSSVVSLVADVDEVFDGVWHHVAFVWEDGAETEGAIYVDGVAVTLTTSNVGSVELAAWQYPMLIAAVNSRGNNENYLVGELDELKMYNYALSKTDVIDQYLAGPADWVCESEIDFDFNGNCIVDIADFATFAVKWLECGRYPQTQCN